MKTSIFIFTFTIISIFNAHSADVTESSVFTISPEDTAEQLNTTGGQSDSDFADLPLIGGIKYFHKDGVNKDLIIFTASAPSAGSVDHLQWVINLDSFTNMINSHTINCMQHTSSGSIPLATGDVLIAS